MGMSVVFLEDEAVDDRTHHFLTNAIVNYAADIRHLYCENSWHTITTNRFEKRKK